MTAEFERELRPFDHGRESSSQLGDSGIAVVVESANVNPLATSHVRFVDQDGMEIAHRVSDEWRDRPEEVMGAIFGLIADHS